MTFKLISSAGKQYMLYNGYKYRETRSMKNGDISWRCCVKSCNSAIKTDVEKIKITFQNIFHNHAAPMETSMTTRRPRCVPAASTPRARPSADSTPDPATHNSSLGRTHTPDPSPLPTTQPVSYTERLLKENIVLKEELSALRKELEAVVNHSVESDLRLLKYTNEIFVVPSTSASNLSNDRETQSQENVRDTGLVGPEFHSTASQTNDSDLQDNIKFKAALATAEEKVLSLEREAEFLRRPCPRCVIYKEETQKIIEVIRVLEEENKALKIMGLPEKDKLPVHSKDKIVRPSQKKKKIKLIMKKNERNANNKDTNNHISSSVTSVKKTQGVQKPNIYFKSVVIAGDSHARHISALVKNRVNENTAVSGLCKPGAGLQDIAPRSTPEPDSCLVLIAGTNDVAAGRQRNIYTYLERVVALCSRNSKMLVATLPVRHDLSHDDPVNMETILVNRFIEEVCERSTNARWLDVNQIDRRHFTRHGLHLSMRGKRALARLIVEGLSGFVSVLPVANHEVSTSLLHAADHVNSTRRRSNTYITTMDNSTVLPTGESQLAELTAETVSDPAVPASTAAAVSPQLTSCTPCPIVLPHDSYAEAVKSNQGASIPLPSYAVTEEIGDLDFNPSLNVASFLETLPPVTGRN